MQHSRSRENCVCVYVLCCYWRYTSGKLICFAWDDTNDIDPSEAVYAVGSVLDATQIADVHTSPSFNVVVAIMLRGKVPKGEDVVDSRMALKITQICGVLDFCSQQSEHKFCLWHLKRKMKFFTAGGEHPRASPASPVGAFVLLFVWSRLSDPPATAMRPWHVAGS